MPVVRRFRGSRLSERLAVDHRHAGIQPKGEAPAASAGPLVRWHRYEGRDGVEGSALRWEIGCAGDWLAEAGLAAARLVQHDHRITPVGGHENLAKAREQPMSVDHPRCWAGGLDDSYLAEPFTRCLEGQRKVALRCRRASRRRNQGHGNHEHRGRDSQTHVIHHWAPFCSGRPQPLTALPTKQAFRRARPPPGRTGCIPTDTRPISDTRHKIGGSIATASKRQQRFRPASVQNCTATPDDFAYAP